MRPPAPISPTAAEHESVVKLSWGYAIAIILLMVVMLALPALRGGGETTVASAETTGSFAHFPLP